MLELVVIRRPISISYLGPYLGTYMPYRSTQRRHRSVLFFPLSIPFWYFANKIDSN